MYKCVSLCLYRGLKLAFPQQWSSDYINKNATRKCRVGRFLGDSARVNAYSFKSRKVNSLFARARTNDIIKRACKAIPVVLFKKVL